MQGSHLENAAIKSHQLDQSPDTLSKYISDSKIDRLNTNVIISQSANKVMRRVLDDDLRDSHVSDKYDDKNNNLPMN